MRHDYESRGLLEQDVVSDGIEQFQMWLDDAISAGVTEPNAMVLSTVDDTGAPHSRHVLLKGISTGGLEFYTNYGSDKGAQIEANPAVALTFPWLALHRQVNIVGTATPLQAEESDAYFALRPRASQLGAWASNQSRVIEDRLVLDDALVHFDATFGEVVPRPPGWGGYRVAPHRIEFWQGRPSRLHDRLRYTLETDVGLGEESSRWRITRHAP
ncbi:MAG: pyridoxamine 5'-phosphate oxidase [Acidimicrobiales bacterium]|jgi:pyridoxamine 5'-phosphate oxidase